MNERIRKLLVEFKEVESQHRGMEVIIGMDEINKFAELIVRECADIAKHNVMNISTYADAEFVEEQIQKHFGVEE